MATLPIDTIERQRWLDPAEQGLQKAVSGAFQRGGAAGSKIEDVLHGTWLRHPLHPVFTDIPLGCWTAAMIFDLIEDFGRTRRYREAADASIAIGLAGAFGAAITGLTDWKDTDPPARKTGLVHGLLNICGALLYTTSLMMRKQRQRGAGRALAYAGMAVATGAAWLGGNLVYELQIGVDHTGSQTPPEEFIPVLKEAELGEGQMKRVEAGGMPVVLARVGGRVYALAETCSHLGGPLHEGQLEDNSVRCPWHGSRFSLEDGRVLEGPTSHPQPCLEIRVNNRQIEVRGRRRQS